MRRRTFMMSSAAGLGLAAPGDRVRVGVAGVRGMGGEHLRMLGQRNDVEIAAVCDVDETLLRKRQGEVEAATGRRPAAYGDFRRMLESAGVDAVAIATPNHWHALLAIWACQAGKDVYVEKPCCHTWWEGRQLLAAARKYGRIVQHGTQARSSAAIQEAVRHLHQGLIGDVYLARALSFKTRDTIGRKPDEPVPPGVNYDLWLGPAPARPFNRNRFHYNWHWHWDYGNGEIGNQGIHQLDMARWGLGARFPRRVSAQGGHFLFDDDQQTPNVLNATFEFDVAGRRKLLVFEARPWITNHEAGIGEKSDPGSIGVAFYGRGGLLTMEWMWKYASFLGKEKAPGPGGEAEPDAWSNFLAAVRSRRSADLNADIEEGLVSTLLVHLANISYRLGRDVYFDPAAMNCGSDSEANAMLRRRYRPPYEVPEVV